MRSLPCLRLERLEIRDCPAAPGLAGLKIEQTGAKTALVSGIVFDEEPSSCLIYLAGAAEDTVAQPDQTGYFEHPITLESLGDVVGQALDIESLLSNQASCEYSNYEPAISELESTRYATNKWCIEGYVGDEWPVGLTVKFTSSVISGANDKTAVVDADHYFRLDIVHNPNKPSGPVYATVTDWWGEESEEVYVIVTT